MEASHAGNNTNVRAETAVATVIPTKETPAVSSGFEVVGEAEK